MTDLLEKQFEKHEPANINGELVQAVKEKALDRVIKILSRDMKVWQNGYDDNMDLLFAECVCEIIELVTYVYLNLKYH